MTPLQYSLLWIACGWIAVYVTLINPWQRDDALDYLGGAIILCTLLGPLALVATLAELVRDCFRH
jgi:hypothetical protein